ncbi:MAG: hypothetical protein J7500_02745 [Sphingomonas sp.]|uniref:hypothetical protein n=1 Tax=Sphingomonas sp. TaxID=28214 RepID=UPI001B2CFBBE|nr:hypothetical protein [Sphingomonas sp.]MBO9621609.1 hypothetical protein [Sphingomonas sp.]
MNQLTLFLGSLAAILLLALAARLLRLGGGAIEGEAAAIREAEAQLSGFEAERAIVGSDGQAALVHGRDGSLALLKQHGTQVAVRRLAATAVHPTPDGLLVASGERRFGDVLVRGAAGVSR